MGTPVLIPVGKTFAMVNPEDVHLICGYKWRLSDKGYAFTQKMFNGERWTVWMHKLICPVNQGIEVDHRNRNRLDNRSENLRPCTHKQNTANATKVAKKCHSTYKGVTTCKRSGKWRAYIKTNKKQIYLGRFETQEQAAMAYNEKAIEIFGEFACLNILGNS